MARRPVRRSKTAATRKRRVTKRDTTRRKRRTTKRRATRTTKVAAKRASPKRTGTAARRPRAAHAAPLAVGEASGRQRKALFRAVQRALAAEGLAGRVTELQLAAAGNKVGCPPGHVRRVVCTRRPDGTIVCEPRCVPL